MRYRPSGLALLLLFVAFSSLPLAAQTKGTEGYVDAATASGSSTAWSARGAIPW
jgi:predicted O-methyltransferase YrrM